MVEIRSPEKDCLLSDSAGRQQERNKFNATSNKQGDHKWQSYTSPFGQWYPVTDSCRKGAEHTRRASRRLKGGRDTTRKVVTADRIWRCYSDTRVLYNIPGMDTSIISPSKFEKKNFTTTIKNEVCELTYRRDSATFGRLNKRKSNELLVTTLWSCLTKN